MLEIATEKAESPDLKDRAYIYWRMLSTSPSKTEEVVLCKKPNIAHDCYNIYDEDFLGKLCSQISNLSSVYHRTADAWSTHLKKFEKPATSPAGEAKKEAPVPEPKVDKKAERAAAKEKKKKAPKKVESSSEEE